MSYQLKENRIMQLDPRIIMHIPADEPFYDRQLRAENIEDIWLHKSGGQHLVFLTENEIAYLPNHTQAIWDGDIFVGLASDPQDIARCFGNPLTMSEVARIQDAVNVGRVITSREVDAALEQSRADLTVEDLTLDTSPYEDRAFEGVVPERLLGNVLGMDRWKSIGSEGYVDWYRTANIEVGFRIESRITSFYKRRPGGEAQLMGSFHSHMPTLRMAA